MDLLQNLTFIVEIITIGLISIVACLYCIAIFHPIRDVLSTYIQDLFKFWFGKPDVKEWWQGINRPVQMTVLAFLIYFIGVVFNGIAYRFTLPMYKEVLNHMYANDKDSTTHTVINNESSFKLPVMPLVQLFYPIKENGYIRHFEDVQKFKVCALPTALNSLDHVLRFIRIERLCVLLSFILLVFSSIKFILFYRLKRKIAHLRKNGAQKLSGLSGHYTRIVATEINQKAVDEDTKINDADNKLNQYVQANKWIFVFALIVYWVTVQAYATTIREYALTSYVVNKNVIKDCNCSAEKK
jgi:hypothetical protein